MIIIKVDDSLIKEIKKKFNKTEANKILDIFETLKNNPKKGKILGTLGGIVIKELKYKSFRFYFITDGYKLKFYNEEALTDLLLRFIRMSNKKEQQKIINEIKQVLINLGPKNFYSI